MGKLILQKRKESAEIEWQVQEFLSKGGRVQNIPYGQVTIDPETGQVPSKQKKWQVARGMAAYRKKCKH